VEYSAPCNGPICNERMQCIRDTPFRAVTRVYHTRSRPRRARPPRTPHRLRGLDRVWPVKSNPHRESGTRFGLRQTLDRQREGSARSVVRYAGTVWATPLEQGHAHAYAASTMYAILAEETRTSVSIARIGI
jgi:hypothetical protein